MPSARNPEWLPRSTGALWLATDCCGVPLGVCAAACPGDAAKAFGGGADFIMMGGVFAGTEEAAGATVVRDGKKFKQFYNNQTGTELEELDSSDEELVVWLSGPRRLRKKELFFRSCDNI